MPTVPTPQSPFPSKALIAPWGKDMQLVAANLINAGEVILTETPLVSTPDADPKYTSFAWDLVDKILASPTIEQQFYACRLKVSKWKMDPGDKENERLLAKRHGCNRNAVKNLYFSVCTNNVGYFDDRRMVVGHGIYPTISRSNHSCSPNASFEPGNIDANEVKLVAMNAIQKGEPITWDYSASEEFKVSDFETRNISMFNAYGFICLCDRCAAEVPAELADLPTRQRYFQDGLKEIIRDEIARRVASFTRRSGSRA